MVMVLCELFLITQDLPRPLGGRERGREGGRREGGRDMLRDCLNYRAYTPVPTGLKDEFYTEVHVFAQNVPRSPAQPHLQRSGIHQESTHQRVQQHAQQTKGSLWTCW